VQKNPDGVGQVQIMRGQDFGGALFEFRFDPKPDFSRFGRGA
jgi:hypothetical protein